LVQNDVVSTAEEEPAAPTEVVEEHNFPAEEDWEKGTD